MNNEQIALARVLARLLPNEIERLRAERDRLRGLLSWAAGRLLDAGDVEGHEKVMAALEQSNG